MERYNRKATTSTLVLLCALLCMGLVEGQKKEVAKVEVDICLGKDENNMPKQCRPKMCWDVRINNPDNFCFKATNWKLSEDVYYTSQERDASKSSFNYDDPFNVCRGGLSIRKIIGQMEIEGKLQD